MRKGGETVEYWSVVFLDENGRKSNYAPDDLNNAKNLSFVIRDFEERYPNIRKFDCVKTNCSGGDSFVCSTPLSFNLDE